MHKLFDNKNAICLEGGLRVGEKPIKSLVTLTQGAFGFTLKYSVYNIKKLTMNKTTATI